MGQRLGAIWSGSDEAELNFSALYVYGVSNAVGLHVRIHKYDVMIL